jgi:hypothetical protein
MRAMANIHLASLPVESRAMYGPWLLDRIEAFQFSDLPGEVREGCRLRIEAGGACDIPLSDLAIVVAGGRPVRRQGAYVPLRRGELIGSHKRGFPRPKRAFRPGSDRFWTHVAFSHVLAVSTIAVAEDGLERRRRRRRTESEGAN